MIQFLGCDKVLIEGVKIVDSPLWCVHPVFSKKVTIRNLRFDAQNPDNDGIAVDSCQDVHIHDVTFGNTGACIALKSGSGREGRELGRPSRNVYIHDCTFNAEAAVAVGPEIGGGIYNVFTENCTVQSQMALAFPVRGAPGHGGEVAHIRFRNVTLPDAQKVTIMMPAPTGDNAPSYHDVPNPAHEPKDANRWPDVYAGADQKVASAGGVAPLAGTVADDGSTLTYKWSVIQGDPEAVKIAEPTSLATRAAFSKEGVFILKLEASDDKATGDHFMMVEVGQETQGMEAVSKPLFK